MRVYFGKPMIGARELSAVTIALKNKDLTNAGIVQQFEERFQEFCGGGIAVAVSSCMAALELCLLARGIGPGDEVIISALTHAAVANAVGLCGATPIFVDSAIESGNMDNRLIEAKVTDKTRIISPVHFLGQPAYMMSTVAICRRHPKIEILEDCALAIDARHSGRHVGLIGMAGCFSFYPVKHMTTGEGGMVLTKDQGLADEIRSLRSFGYGMDRNGDIQRPGRNCRMTEMQAAMGIEQLKKLPKLLMQRALNANLVKEMLADFHPIGGNYAVSVFVPDGVDRDKLRHRLLQNKIETSVYYRIIPPLLSWVRKRHGYEPGDFPIAERISARTITLPVGPHLDRDRIVHMCKKFRECLEGATNENRAYRRSRIHRASSGGEA